MLGDPRKAVRAMSGPLIISFLVVQINSFADTSWCSMLGLDPSSAVSTISPVYWIVAGIGTGVGVGASTSIARHLGRGDRENAESIVSQTMFVGVLVTVAATPVMYLLLDPSIGMMGADDIRDLCRAYIDPIVIFSLAHVLSGIMSGILRAEGAAKKSTLMLLVSAILNIILDPVFMFTLDMGVAGAGWATSVSAGISVLIGIGWYMSGSMYLGMSFKGFRPKMDQIREILLVGVPRATESFLISLMSMVQRIFVIICGGTVGAALYNIPWRFVSLAEVVSQSTGAALVPISSAALGTNDFEKAQEANRYSLRITVIAMIVIAAILFVFADWALIPFTLSESMESMRPQFAHVLRIYAVLIPFIGLIDIGSSILQSLRLAQMSMFCSFFRNIIIVVFLVFACHISMDAIFYSLLVSEIIGGFMMIVLAKKEFDRLASHAPKARTELRCGWSDRLLNFLKVVNLLFLERKK